jgi:hypothetical protein
MCTESARVPCVKSRGANALGIYRLSRDRNSCDRWRLRRHTNYQQLRLLGYDRRLYRARWREAIKTDRGRAEKPKFTFFGPALLRAIDGANFWPRGWRRARVPIRLAAIERKLRLVHNGPNQRR